MTLTPLPNNFFPGEIMNIRKTTTLALLTTISLIIFLLENMLPPLVPIPGIKLGLANIITLIVLVRFSHCDAILVTVTRVILGFFFAGSIMSLTYSMLGSALSLTAMIILHTILSKKYIFLTSIIGAIFHNIGQIIAAVLFTSTPYIVAYLPFLMISGIITGLFTGLCAFFTEKKLPDFIR